MFDFGIGGYSLSLKLKNHTADEAFDLGYQPVRPGEEVELTARGINIEVGYGL